jgi:aspartate 1-decarboxylase
MFLKSKIHRATVTDSDLHYEGSLGIDADLMKAANILPYELIQVYNINNGERFETYALKEAPKSGIIALKGAAARKGTRGDLIIITCFAPINDQDLGDFKPAIVLVDETNRLKEDT